MYNIRDSFFYRLWILIRKKNRLGSSMNTHIGMELYGKGLKNSSSMYHFTTQKYGWMDVYLIY